MKFNLLFEKIISDTHELFATFIEKRSAGAKKVEESARSKGKFSILTAYHFAGKAVPYARSLKKKDDAKSAEFFKESYKETLDKLKDLDSLSQKQFQTLTGALEVWGEVYIQSKDKKDYSR